MEQAVSALVRKCSSQSSFGDHSTILIESASNDDILHPLRTKPREAKHAIRKRFVSMCDPKLLLDEAVDSDCLRIRRIQIRFPQFGRAYLFDFPQLKVRAFNERTASAVDIFHRYFFLGYCLLRAIFKSSSAEKLRSSTFRKATANWGSKALRRFNSSIGGRLSWAFNSSKGTFSMRARSFRFSSEGNRRPNSMSDRKAAEHSSFLAKSRSERSRSFRSSRIRSPSGIV